MKILKKGNNNLRQKKLYNVTIYDIECENCGCLFEAQDTELYSEGGYTMYKCPYCNMRLTLEYNYTKYKCILPISKIDHYNCLIHTEVK